MRAFTALMPNMRALLFRALPPHDVILGVAVHLRPLLVLVSFVRSRVREKIHQKPCTAVDGKRPER